MVVRRGKGEYAAINVNLDEYNRAQRVGLAMLAWDQIVSLMKVNGEPTANAFDVAAKLAEAFDASPAGIKTARYAMNRDGEEHLSKLISGEVELTPFFRLAGMKKGYRAKEGVVHGADGITYFGKGDPFVEVTEPLKRYLRAWKKRNFEYRHVAPKEAKKRLVVIQELRSLLEEAQGDLEKRSHLATLGVPSERKERKR